MTTKDAYDTLSEKLGFPGSSRLRTILGAVMTPAQARLAEALPGTIGEVAQKTGMSEDDARKNLEELFRKGAVFPKGDFAKRDSYKFARDIVQFHDATHATRELDPRKDKIFFEMWHEFCLNEMYGRLAEAIRCMPTPMFRLVPAYNSIKGLPDILPCEDFHALLEAQDRIAVVPCSCRYRTAAVGEPCEHTVETDTWKCLQFGRGADYVINRGSGKSLTKEEALELCDTIERDGLLHIWPNNATMTGINTSCQCCRDCCENYVALDRAGVSIGTSWQKSRYEAEMADIDACDGCQECVDRCHFDAIEMVKVKGQKRLKASVDPEKCFGCGVCVLGCEPQALEMRQVRPPEFIPGAA